MTHSVWFSVFDVSEKLGRTDEVVVHGLDHNCRSSAPFCGSGEGRLHVAEPRITGRLVDRERCVAHAQPRVAAVFAVGRGPAPVLDQEERQASLGAGEVGRIHRPQKLVGLHAGVERLDQVGEEVAPDDVVDAHLLIRLVHPIDATVSAMSAYLIINYSITDADQFGEYFALAGPALKIGTECEAVVVDSASEQLEGESAGHQTVVLKFESKEQANAIYESGDYQAALGKRLAATSNHFAVLVDGLS